jgi:hypothetical protein
MWYTRTAAVSSAPFEREQQQQQQQPKGGKFPRAKAPSGTALFCFFAVL